MIVVNSQFFRQLYLSINENEICLGEQRDSRAAERQHCQGAVHRGEVSFAGPCPGPRVL